ncbi:MAG: DUF2330 domain-containing protein [Actinomycetota bacterium]
MRRIMSVAVSAGLMVLVATGPAWACGGLVGANGAVNLLRTSTLAAYRDGVEHYVTSFQFAGDSGSVGSIVPLPGVPSSVRKGGDWTLQRLQQEIAPAFKAVAVSAEAASLRDEAQVLLEKRISGLDITILKGGGDAVGRWAEENEFNLTPDAPEVLDFYAARSPIFMAARFDIDAATARGFQAGDGVPIHLTIPTPNPWVPLRILGLGKDVAEVIEADVFLLTEREPTLMPQAVPGRGLFLERSEPASQDLLVDLRSDRGMKWLPRDDMWFSHLRIAATAGQLQHDLAIEATGLASPSLLQAGLVVPGVPLALPGPLDPIPPDSASPLWTWVAAIAVALGTVALVTRTVSRRL